MSFKDLEGQLARWLERLQQYEFEVIHLIKGNLIKMLMDYQDVIARSKVVNIVIK